MAGRPHAGVPAHRRSRHQCKQTGPAALAGPEGSSPFVVSISRRPWDGLLPVDSVHAAADGVCGPLVVCRGGRQPDRELHPGPPERHRQDASRDQPVQGAATGAAWGAVDRRHGPAGEPGLPLGDRRRQGTTRDVQARADRDPPVGVSRQGDRGAAGVGQPAARVRPPHRPAGDRRGAGSPSRVLEARRGGQAFPRPADGRGQAQDGRRHGGCQRQGAADVRRGVRPAQG
mmetsp:Transcript_31406/g.91113  ORF Transcript_31406/g.91113 Transcript_31406/m.91113 type:complete len:230 (-) Transcript_31406:102-791(-)